MDSSKKRIEFVDLAKGICIILVIAGHCGIPVNKIPGFEMVRMPLYFALSGLFFKDYGGLGQFTLRKTNKLLVPFVFWYLLAYTIMFILERFVPDALSKFDRGILDVFFIRDICNTPIWFLLALFWCNILFCFINLYVKRELFRIIIVCIMGGAGWYLGNVAHIFTPCFIDVALTSLPFFTFGYYLKKTSILFPNKYDRYNLLFAIVFWFTSFVLYRAIGNHRMFLQYNVLEGWSTYVISFASVISLLFLCKTLKRIPLITYMGRYSIILLCTHALCSPIVRLVSHVTNTAYSVWIVGLLTLVISTLMIPLCKKFIPWFVAQKDLITIKAKS